MRFDVDVESGYCEVCCAWFYLYLSRNGAQVLDCSFCMLVLVEAQRHLFVVISLVLELFAKFTVIFCCQNTRNIRKIAHFARKLSE